MKILIVEDEIQLLDSMTEYLQQEGYICERATGFLDADEKMALYEYGVVVLDITLPDGNGLYLLHQLKKEQPDTGVLIVSARNSLDDKLKGLDWGADDYITKPFHLAELNSRIKALIRRRNFRGRMKLIFNEIEIDPDEREIIVNNQKLDLTRKEYDLLLYFVTNKKRVLSKGVIAEFLWGDNIDLADNFDFIYTHIKNIRKKILQAGGEDYIKSVYGLGYKFTDE